MLEYSWALRDIQWTIDFIENDPVLDKYDFFIDEVMENAF